jgi:hypothetical protein
MSRSPLRRHTSGGVTQSSSWCWAIRLIVFVSVLALATSILLHTGTGVATAGLVAVIAAASKAAIKLTAGGSHLSLD